MATSHYSPHAYTGTILESQGENPKHPLDNHMHIATMICNCSNYSKAFIKAILLQQCYYPYRIISYLFVLP